MPFLAYLMNSIDKFAPLPYEARPVYAIGSLLLSRLEEDDGIASAIDILDFTLRFDKEIRVKSIYLKYIYKSSLNRNNTYFLQ